MYNIGSANKNELLETILTDDKNVLYDLPMCENNDIDKLIDEASKNKIIVSF